MGNDTLSEVVQRLAFSFGYKWGSGSQRVMEVGLKNYFLVFEPNSKVISYGMNPHSDTVVKTFEEATKLFKNPPLAPKQPLDLGHGFFAKENGDVLTGWNNIPAKEFEAMLEKRKNFLQS